MRTITSTLIVVALVLWAGDAWAQRGGQGGRGQRGGGQRGSATQRVGGNQGQMGGWLGQGQSGQMQQGQGRGGQGQRGQGQGQAQGGQGQRGQGQGQRGQGQGQRGQGQRGQGQRGQGGGQLTQPEADGLAYMLQEEKLARDVYLTLGETWNLRVFDNIARAESRHMQAVSRLMSQYDVANPMTRDVRGEFADPRLSNLYRVLVEKGMQSPEAALQVGVQIEKLDIADLQTEMANISSPDVKRIYQNLMKGSEQHLRAFNSRLGGR